MPINRVRIQEYLRQGEGAPPPVFVGHDDILKDILTTAKDSAGQPKKTRIVQGAPGAGKSSLLHRMQELWIGTDGTPRVVTVSSAAVSRDIPGVIQAIMAAGVSDPDGWRKIVGERLRRLTSIGASVAGYGLSAEFDAARDASLLSTAIRKGREKVWNHPVIIAVDEAQAMKGDPHSATACFLREIHNADTGLPVVLVLAGLSDTVGKADGMQLTRGREVHEVKPLATAEAREFIRKLALWFGLDTSRHNPRLEPLADICDGWPRHLRFAGVSLAEEALRMDGDMDRMDWDAIRTRTYALRQEYYSDQTSLEMQEADILTARVMAGLKDGMRTRHMEELVENCRADRPGQRLREGKSALWFIDRLIHQGALYRTPDGRVHSPIPSFRSYLVERGTEPRLTPDREDNPDTDPSP